MSTPGTPVVFCTACGAHNIPDARFCQTCGRAMFPMEAIPASASIAAYASHPYGGFWIRLLAWIIDAIVIGIVLVPFSMAFGLPMPGADFRLHTASFFASRLALRLFVVWLYEALMTSSSTQATLGKMALGLRVTDVQGNRITFGRATARVFAKYLSMAILFMGYLMVAFTAKKQGLHDILAGTVVQKTR